MSLNIIISYVLEVVILELRAATFGFRLDVTGKNLLALFGLGCFFFFLLIMFEYKFFYHRKRSSKLPNGLRELEDDVLAEERAVNEGEKAFLLCLADSCGRGYTLFV